MAWHTAGVVHASSSLGQRTDEGAVWCGDGALGSEDLGDLGSSLDSSINRGTEAFSSLGNERPPRLFQTHSEKSCSHVGRLPWALIVMPGSLAFSEYLLN